MHVTNNKQFDQIQSYGLNTPIFNAHWKNHGIASGRVKLQEILLPFHSLVPKSQEKKVICSCSRSKSLIHWIFMLMTTVCRKVATLCFLEIGLELLFSAMPQARRAQLPSPAQRHLRWGHRCCGTGWSRLRWPPHTLPQHPRTILVAGLPLRGAAPACQWNGGKAQR